MKRKMEMLIGIIVFFAVATITFMISTVVFSTKCVEMRGNVETFKNEAEICRGNVASLLREKRELLRRNEELQRNNEILAAAYNDLTNQLKNNATVDKPVEEPVDEQPPLYYEPEQPESRQMTIDWTFDRLPDYAPTNTFRCEPFRVVDQYNEFDDVVIFNSAFAKSSEQYALQQECVTDSTTGIRVYFDDTGAWWYCAALATAYGTTIGQTYEFTLQNGTVLPVICADFKHDISQPRADDFGDSDTNYDGEACINILEFVVDMQLIPEEVRKAGTMSALEQFGGLYGHGGCIVDVQDTGRRWKV